MSAMKFREPNQVLWRGVRPGHNGTQFTISDEHNTDIKVLHTVNDNVTFHLVSCTLSVKGTGIDQIGMLRFRDAADLNYVSIITLRLHAIFSMNAELCFPYPLEIPEKYDIVIQSNAAALQVYGFIHGWEE